MKKLIILLFIISLTSTANAAFTWSVDVVTIDLSVSNQTVVQLISSDALAYPSLWGGGGTPTIAKATSVIALPAAGSANIWGPDENGTFAVGASNPIASGPHYDVTITGLAVGSTNLIIDEYGSAGAMDTISVNVVPEPMTIVLFGLGGLLIRRR